MPHRRPTSFFVDAHGGLRAGRLLALAALAALAGTMAFANPSGHVPQGPNPAAAHHDSCQHARVHATIRR